MMGEYPLSPTLTHNPASLPSLDGRGWGRVREGDANS